MALSVKKQSIILMMIIYLLLFTGGSAGVYAQTDTPTPTPSATATDTPTATLTPTATNTPLPIVVTSTEPTQLLGGAKANLSIFGSNFTTDTTVRLVGFGLLTVNFINANALIAELPATVPVGTYSIEIRDLQGGTQLSPNTLTIITPSATPTASKPAPTITPTLIPASPVPGQPLLMVTRYIAIPQTVLQGETVTFSVTIINQGNRTAMTPTASFETGGSMIPSNAQTSISLPNIGPNASHTFTLNALASPTANNGLNTVVLSLNYSDFQHQAFSSQATLTVDVQVLVKMPQLSLNGYAVNPDPIQPGSPVTVNLLIANSGTLTASQLRLSLPVGTGVLLAGSQGNSFNLGDIVPGGEVAISLPLNVSTTALSGIQPQSFTLAYLQEGIAQTTDIQLTLNVGAAPTSTILLDSYNYGKETIAPGERFVFEATIVNIGTAPIENALLSFGYPPGTTGVPFAVIEGGGSVFLETIPANGGRMTVSQEFITNGTLPSAVYPLPLTLKHNEGVNSIQEMFNASILVIIPPRYRFIEDLPIPQSVRIGDTVNLSLTLLNTGRAPIQLVSGQIIAPNFDILTEGNLELQALQMNSEQIVDGTLIAAIEGQSSIWIAFSYLDDFNQEGMIVQEYPIEILPAPPPPPTRPPQTTLPEPMTLTELEPEAFSLPDDFWERLLLAILGLGY
jgi:hypothetical protein